MFLSPPHCPGSTYFSRIGINQSPRIFSSTLDRNFVLDIVLPSSSSLTSLGSPVLWSGTACSIFHWAGHISRRYETRWGSVMLDWTPARGRRFNELGEGRRQARPKTRWEDCLSDYFAHASEDTHWRIIAANKEAWDQHLRAFSSFTD